MQRLTGPSIDASSSTTGRSSIPGMKCLPSGDALLPLRLRVNVIFQDSIGDSPASIVRSSMRRPGQPIMNVQDWPLTTTPQED